MSCREDALRHHFPDFLGKFQKTKRIGDRCTILADSVGNVFLAKSILIDQSLISHCFFHGIQVSSLHVLDDSYFCSLLSGVVADDHRHFLKTGFLCGPETAFTGNDSVLFSAFLNKQRLQNTKLPDRSRQFLQFRLIKVLSRLFFICLDLGKSDQDLPGLFCRICFLRLCFRCSFLCAALFYCRLFLSGRFP